MPAPATTAQAEGNPYYIEQLMKSLVEENQLEVAGGWNIAIEPDALELPTSCDQLIHRRLERMEQGTRQVLEVMAVIGRPATLGLMLPPSLPLIVYGVTINESITKRFMAGVFPGLMMAGLFILYILVRCKLQPELGPPLPKEERDIGLKESSFCCGPASFPS